MEASHMVKCPICSEKLEQKEGTKKLCAQIGNPDIAIVQARNPSFCNTCNEYYMNTKEIKSTVLQIKNMGSNKKKITTGIYS